MKIRSDCFLTAAVALWIFCVPFRSDCQVLPRLAEALSASAPRSAVRNNLSPRLRLAEDLGALPETTPVLDVKIYFAPTPAQDAALTSLLADQGNPASPHYRQWLTPETYAARFGLSSADLARAMDYFTAYGLEVAGVSRSHSFLALRGTVAQVDSAFGTVLHRVSVRGEQHFAILTEPTLPVALAQITRGITGLDDFRLHPRARVLPRYTASGGVHSLAPGDFYTLYDVAPLLTSSITGAGVTVAVLGQTDVPLASIAAFRSASGLPANLPVVKLYGADPGTSAGDLPEALLDLEWSGAAAPAATILYVNSTDVIAGSLTAAVDNNLAPIISMSYGDCEQELGSTNLAIYQQVLRQANAQGQTVVGAAGDSGAADCDYNVRTATQGYAVDFPASSPNVIGIGGTMLNEGAGTYFSSANGAYAGSALSYIPETVWNESAGYGALAAGGGGASAYFTKPSYQTGTGVPSDSARDVPELALASAVLHDGYLVCLPGDCTNGFANAGGGFSIIGGTSIAAPQFAGMLALLEQKIQARVGNANPVLYGLANSRYATSVFHDITTGNNAVPCTAGSTNCSSGGTLGFTAGVGYDQATGLGSVDVYNLVSDWLLVTPAGTASGTALSSTILQESSASVTSGSNVLLTATVTGSAGTGPTGTVQFLVDNIAIGGAVALVSGTATYSLSSSGLGLGTHNVTAAYSGDSLYAGSKASVVLGVVAATQPDFTLTPGVTTSTVSSGKDAPGLFFTVTPVNGFNGSITFLATALPTSGTAFSASFSVSPVVLSGTATGSTVLTLSAYLPAVRVVSAAGSLPPFWPFAAGAVCLCLLPHRRRRLSVGIAVVALVSLAGCSGGSTTAAAKAVVNTPPGTYTVLVTATGTSSTGAVTSHNSTVTFVVQ